MIFGGLLISRASGQGTLYRGSRPCRSSIKPFTPTSSAFQNYRIFRRPPFLRRNFRLKYERDGPGLDSYGFIEYLCEFQNFQIMHLKIEPKKVVDAYSTPIVQQTSFWSKVKERLGMDSRAFDFSVRNSEIYTNVGGYAHTQGDFITFFQYLNTLTVQRSSLRKRTTAVFWKSCPNRCVRTFRSTAWPCAMI